MVATALYCFIERRRRSNSYTLAMPRILDPAGRDGRMRDPYGDEVQVTTEATDEGSRSSRGRTRNAVALGAMGEHVERVDVPEDAGRRGRRGSQRRSYADVESELAEGDPETDRIIENMPTTELGALPEGVICPSLGCDKDLLRLTPIIFAPLLLSLPRPSALDEARFFFAQLDRLRKERATFTVILRVRPTASMFEKICRLFQRIFLSMMRPHTCPPRHNRR